MMTTLGANAAVFTLVDQALLRTLPASKSPLHRKEPAWWVAGSFYVAHRQDHDYNKTQ
jgi:hypothetical protein